MPRRRKNKKFRFFYRPTLRGAASLLIATTVVAIFCGMLNLPPAYPIVYIWWMMLASPVLILRKWWPMAITLLYTAWMAFIALASPGDFPLVFGLTVWFLMPAMVIDAIYLFLRFTLEDA